MIENLTERELKEVRDGLATTTLHKKIDSLLRAGNKLVTDYADVMFSQLSHGVAFDTGLVVPANSIIEKAWLDVSTTFAGDGDDTSSLSIGVATAVDLVADTTIKAVGNAWDQGIHACIPVGTVATMIKNGTSDKNVKVTLTIAATDTKLVAGKMRIFIQYAPTNPNS